MFCFPLYLQNLVNCCESKGLFFFFSFLATTPPLGLWIVEEVMSLHATQWKFSYSPSPPQSPLLTFLSSPDHQKPGAVSSCNADLIKRVVKLSLLDVWDSWLFFLLNVFLSDHFLQVSDQLHRVWLWQEWCVLARASLSDHQILHRWELIYSNHSEIYPLFCCLL